jgi:hypothetical protein
MGEWRCTALVSSLLAPEKDEWSVVTKYQSDRMLDVPQGWYICSAKGEVCAIAQNEILSLSSVQCSNQLVNY